MGFTPFFTDILDFREPDPIFGRMLPPRRLILMVLAVKLPVLTGWAEWELFHPEREAVSVRQFIDNTGTRAVADLRYARIDWEAGALETPGDPGIRVPSGIARYGLTSSWFMKATTVDPWEGDPFNRSNLFHVPDTSVLDAPGFDLDLYEVELPETDWGRPRRIVDVSSSGRHLLLTFENLPFNDYQRLMEHDPESGWRHLSLDGERIISIGGSAPPDLFAVARRESVDDRREVLFQLTDSGWIEVAVLAIEEVNVIPSLPRGNSPLPLIFPDPGFLNWFSPPPIRLPGPDVYFFPFPSFEVVVTDSSVFIGDAPCLYVYNRETGELETLDNFPQGRIYPEEGNPDRLLVHREWEMGYYDLEAETFTPIDSPFVDFDYFGDIVYNTASSEWIFNYNGVSVARTSDFLTFEHVNRSRFGNVVIDLEPVGENLYALLNSNLMSWSEAAGWQTHIDWSTPVPGIIYSVRHVNGAFYLGGFGEVYVTTEFESFSKYESRSLEAKIAMDTVDGKIVPVEGPVPVDQLLYHEGAFWAVLKSTLRLSDKQVKVLRSENLLHWTLIGDWEPAVVGFSSESAYILIGTPSAVHRIDMGKSNVERLSLPPDVALSTDRRLGTRSPLAGRGEELLAIGTNSRSDLTLLRFRPDSGWVILEPDLAGSDWNFVGVTDRYHLQVVDQNNQSRAVETIHGDAFTWFGNLEGIKDIVHFDGQDYGIGHEIEIWKRPFDPMETLLPDNQFLGNGWWLQDELGYLYLTDLPWVLSLDHGWWLFDMNTEDGWRVFDSHYGWLQTSEDLFPEFYSFREQTWLRYALGSRTPDRWFYHYETEVWRKESGG